MLNHPPLASSHCTSTPRLRPPPRSPRPCPAEDRRARKPSSSVTDTHIHFVLIFPAFGTSPPRPGRTRAAGLTRSPSAFVCRWARSRKKLLCQISSRGRVLRLFSATHSLLSRRKVSLQLQLPLPKTTSTPTFLSREEGSCTLPTENLSLKERIYSRRSDRPSPPLAEQHPSCPPAPGFSPGNGSFPASRSTFSPRAETEGLRGCWDFLSKIPVNCLQ